MPDDATVNETSADAEPDHPSGAGESAEEVRRSAQEDIERADDSGDDRHEAQEGVKATPTQHEAEAATAARTPSEQAGKQARAEYAQQQDEAGDAGAGNADSPRTAKDIVADGEAPLAPMPGRAEPADRRAGSPADAEDSDEVQEDQERA